MQKDRQKIILIFVDWFAPGYLGGGLIQSCVNVAKLLQTQYRIYVFTRDRDFQKKQAYPEIPTNQWMSFDEAIKVYYCSPDQLNSRTISQICTAIAPDYIYLNSMYSFYFSIVPIWLFHNKSSNVTIVLAPRGMLQTGAIHQKYWKKKLFLWLFMHCILIQKMIFHATDKQEVQDIKMRLGKHSRVVLVSDLPNLQLPFYPKIEKKKGQLNCIYLSRISPKKNLLLVLEILQSINFPVCMTIIGGIEDIGYWRKCKNQIERLPSFININFLGALAPKEAHLILAKQDLFLFPTAGENFGHVVFESLSLGVPVLLSHQTPWKNLEQQKAGVNIPIDNLLTYRNWLKKFWSMDTDVYNLWSKGAKTYVQSWQDKLDFKAQYDQLFSIG